MPHYLLFSIANDHTFLVSSEYPFGYKAKQNIGLCTSVMKDMYNRKEVAVLYYVHLLSSLRFVTQLINSWKLFHKVLENGVSFDIVRLLSLCYSHSRGSCAMA